MSEQHTYYARNHTGWGNSIGITDWSAGRIHGWLKRIPRVGDRIVFDMKSGDERAMVVTEVHRPSNGDPADMFFATIEVSA